MSNNKGKAIIFSAPSGAGKTTIIHRLLESGLGLSFSISACSREKRAHETDGVDYYFLSPDEFRKRIDHGDFLEWEEVYPGKYYGTLISELERIWESGKHVVFDVDVKGGLNIRQKLGDRALAIFVGPPSVKVLEERLRARGTESEDSLKARIGKAEYEMTFQSRFDKVIVNDDLDKAVNEALQLVIDFLA
ncbi:MAG: guanylate kinase [Bacteroidetes bacterium]|nr:guanylate kinase [Bacteroidota bacterium]MBU1719269.1 guanylate kinase [Bacteroidota bacterium]